MDRTIREALEDAHETDSELLEWVEQFGSDWQAAWAACADPWWACCLAMASRRVELDQMIEALAAGLGPGADRSWRTLASDATAMHELGTALQALRLDPASTEPVIDASRDRLAGQAEAYRRANSNAAEQFLERFKSALRHLFE